MKIKSMLKKFMIKFISNTQVKEINDLSQAYSMIENEKKELEIKNKKFQEIFSSIIREKEEKDKKIDDLAKELEKYKKQVQEKDKKITELEKRIRIHKCIDKTAVKKTRINSNYILFLIFRA
jgi:DNA repair exonuclease SbcCD ATPase subunit